MAHKAAQAVCGQIRYREMTRTPSIAAALRQRVSAMLFDHAVQRYPILMLDEPCDKAVQL